MTIGFYPDGISRRGAMERLLANQPASRLERVKAWWIKRWR